MQGVQSCGCFHQAAAVALQLQRCLISPSPSKVQQFTFEYCPQSYKTSSGIYHWSSFGRLAGHLTPALSFCYFSCLYLLGVCLLDPPLITGAGSAFHTPPLPPRPLLLVLSCNLLFILFSFVWRGFSLSRDCTGLCFWGIGRVVTCGVCCLPVHSANRTQAALELASREKWLSTFFSAVCVGRLSTG
jgi:hypothetical protein